MNNRTVIITLPRTGSTTYCNKLTMSIQNKLNGGTEIDNRCYDKYGNYLGEHNAKNIYFNERPIESKWVINLNEFFTQWHSETKLYQKHLYNKNNIYIFSLLHNLNLNGLNVGNLTKSLISDEEYINVNYDINSKIEYIKNTENWVLKIFPHHIEKDDLKRRPWGGLDFYKTLITLSTNHKFLYRKNFIDQVKSYACAVNSNLWGNRRRDKFSIKISDKEIIDAKKILMNEYYKMKNLYDLFPAEIMAYEDFATPEEKYPDYKNVQGNFDIIEDFDVLKEVFGK